MQEQLISKQTALLAKELGLKPSLNNSWELTGYNLKDNWVKPSSYKVHSSFPEPEEFLFAPSQTLLQKWLRDEHKIYVETFEEKGIYVTWVHYYNEYGDKLESWNQTKNSGDYEKSLEYGLMNGLTLLKERQNGQK